MDFQTLNRRELQVLCKLNKIPVNMTNIAMIDALKSLETVEGIEEFLNLSRPETARLPIESPERVPHTSCRTSRKKAKIEESESLPATANKATFHGVMEQWAGEVNEVLKTPLTSLNFYLNCICKRLCYVPLFQIYAGSGSIETPLGDNVGEGSVENNVGVSIEKVENDCNELKKVDVVLDESYQNPTIEKVVHVNDTLESGKEKVKSGEIIEKFEDVDLEERHDDRENFVMNEVYNFEENSDQVVDNLKPDSEGICNLCEDGYYLGEKQMVVDEKIDVNEEALNVSVKEHDAFLVPEEHTDIILVESDGIAANAIIFDDENPSDPSILKPEGMQKEVLECNGALNMVVDLIHLNTENPSEPSKLVPEENQFSANANDDVIDLPLIKGMSEVSDSSKRKLEEVVIEENEETINEKDKKPPKSLDKNNTPSLRQLKKKLKASLISSSTSVKISDNKEKSNMQKLEVAVEENQENIKEEEDEKKPSLNSLSNNSPSLRQLKKQLKTFQTKYNKVREASLALQAV